MSFSSYIIITSVLRKYYKYFIKPNTLITANTDKDSCYSCCNDSFELKTPECKIYNKKGASLNTKKNYIFKRL